MLVRLEGREGVGEEGNFGREDIPRMRSSGRSGESATRRPPKPQPMSATVISFVKRFIPSASSSWLAGAT